MGNVVKLPTAAPKRVRQPSGRGSWKAAIAEAKAGGVYAPCPAEYLHHTYREALAKHDAERVARQALYTEAGFAQDGPSTLAACILTALPPEQQDAVLERLEKLRAYSGDAPALRGALTFAKRILGRA